MKTEFRSFPSAARASEARCRSKTNHFTAIHKQLIILLNMISRMAILFQAIKKPLHKPLLGVYCQYRFYVLGIRQIFFEDRIGAV